MDGQIDLTEPELHVMQVVWSSDEVCAKDVIAELEKTCGYSASTSYTLIYRCIKKGGLSRTDPGFYLRSLVSQEQVRSREVHKLADRLYGGSIDSLFASLIDGRELSDETVQRLKTAIDEYEKGIQSGS